MHEYRASHGRLRATPVRQAAGVLVDVPVAVPEETCDRSSLLLCRFVEARHAVTGHEEERVAEQDAELLELLARDAYLAPRVAVEARVEVVRDGMGASIQEDAQSPRDAELVVVLLEAHVQNLVAVGKLRRAAQGAHGLPQERLGVRHAVRVDGRVEAAHKPLPVAIVMPVLP